MAENDKDLAGIAVDGGATVRHPRAMEEARMVKLGVVLLAIGLAGCVQSTSTRTSVNTVMIDTGAAPICGSGGAARISAKMAAVETLRNGYERYVITGAQSANNVRTSQIGGTFQATGSTVTYTPTTVVSGSHDRTLMVTMLKRGDAGYESGIDARQELGPEWATLARDGIKSCF